MATQDADALRRERDRFVGFAFASADLLLGLDDSCCVKWAAGAVRSMLGVDPDGAQGLPISSLFPRHDALILTSALHKLQLGQRRQDINLSLEIKPDSHRPIRSSIYRSLKQDAPEYLLAVSLRAAEASEAVTPRRRDRATGLLDAVEFAEATSSALKSARSAGKSTCLTLVQICGAGELERLLGPERSEALMAEVGSKLRLHAMDPDAAAKIGDGKFSVAHFADEDPSAVSDAISRLGDSYQISPTDLKLTETTIKFHGDSLAEADVESILSYILEKFSAEGTAAIDDGSAEKCLRRMTAETLTRVVTMRDLIHERRLTLHYQPIVALTDRSVHHYEVLLRFADGRSPFEDIQFAEQINTIHEIDLAVTQGAAGRILEAVAAGQELSLAVNMSARSLLNDTFMGMFDELAAKLGKNRGKLIVEVTESAKLEDLAKAARWVDHLNAKGHLVCLDDFGAGASSLPYLQHLHVGSVKIDGAYIRGLTESSRERAIIHGVLATCKSLGITTVAEMIEREEQHKCLLDLGVDLGQGWLYGRPAAMIPPAPQITPNGATARVARRLDPKAIGRMLVKK